MNSEYLFRVSLQDASGLYVHDERKTYRAITLHDAWEQVLHDTIDFYIFKQFDSINIKYEPKE